MKKPYELCLRLSDAERKQLESNAKQCGLRKSAYLRKLLSGVPIRARPSPEICQLCTEINRIGTNINQITRKINAGFGSRTDVDEIRFLLRKIYKKMECRSTIHVGQLNKKG